MSEAIHLSLSQRANHLTTHFFNSQESHLDYTKSVTKADNNPNFFFKPTLSIDKTTVNYNPRALIWDLKGGFGALGQFEYFEQSNQGDNDNEDGDQWYGKIQQMKRDPIPKSAYQRALDNYESLPKLNNENTSYWTDYSKVLYEPNAYNELSHWEVDPTKYPNGRLSLGQEREFIDYEVGVEEWKSDGIGMNFLENRYRTMLEGCDSLGGVNVVSEIDSAWGGFTSEMLDEVRDDYNPKSSVFTWGIFNGVKLENLSTKDILSRIKTFLSLQKSSSLFIPLSTPRSLPQQLNIDRSSHWQTSAVQNLVFEPFQRIMSQREHNVKFSTIEDNLTLGSDRRLVSKVNASAGDYNFSFSDDFFKIVGNEHAFSKSTVNKPPKASPQQDITDLAGSLKDSKSLDDKKSQDKSITEYRSNIPYGLPDSYPDNLVDPNDRVTATMEITTAPRKTLSEMKSYVSKFTRGDDRENMIQELETLAEKYEYGWNDSDESDDDY